MINDLKQRAYEQERSENFGRAIELYESVIDHRETEGLTHQDASVFLRIADLHLRRDQEEDAIEAFQRAGELYAREGLQPQAIAVYRRILRIAPEHTEALWNLAWLHAEMGVMAEARDYVGDYLQTVDMERDWVEAKDFLRRLLDLSGDVAIGLRLAELQEEAGRHDEALDVLERLDVDVGAPSALDEEEIRERIEAVRGEVVPDQEQLGEEVSFEGAAHSETGDAEAELAEDDVAEDEDEFAGAGSGLEDTTPEFDDFEEETSGLGEEPGEPEDDEEYDLEVGAGETGSLDEGFPFPDADDQLGNGAADDDVLEGFEDEDAADGEAASDYGWNEPGETVGREPGAPTGSGDDVEEEEPAPAADGEELSGQEPDRDSRPEHAGEGAWETDEFDEHRDEEEEDEDQEEPMSTHSQDLPGGPAVDDVEEEGETQETLDASPPPRRDEEAEGVGGASAAAGVGDAGGSTDYEGEYGEKAELRRGLDVLDELIELDPDRLDHYRRRVGYAERLDDSDALLDSYEQMASALRRRDSWRGARLVYEHVLGLDVDAEAAREGIEELARRAREALDVPELLPDADVPSGPEAERTELGRRIWPELGRVRDRVQWLQGAAELLRSGDRDDFGGDTGDGPPAEAYELAGRYFLARGDADEAIDVLSLALDREDLDDDELVDVLFQLGLSHYRIDDRGSARKYFERVASHDEDFGTVYDWVLS